MLGTGGASRAAGLAAPRFGDCSRNVPIRSVMEPELSLRSSIELGRPFTDALRELETDPRRCVRLVCTSATFVGVVGRDLRAAPAAAAARFAFDFCVERKARAAAEVAAESAPAPLALKCCCENLLAFYLHFIQLPAREVKAWLPNPMKASADIPDCSAPSSCDGT